MFGSSHRKTEENTLTGHSEDFWPHSLLGDREQGLKLDHGWFGVCFRMPPGQLEALLAKLDRASSQLTGMPL